MTILIDFYIHIEPTRTKKEKVDWREKNFEKSLEASHFICLKNFFRY